MIQLRETLLLTYDKFYLNLSNLKHKGINKTCYFGLKRNIDDAVKKLLSIC